jgi:hypothetical protein
MAKTPTYQTLSDPPDSEERRFVAHAAAVAFGGQVTAMARKPGVEESTWLRHKKIAPALPLVGANCALGPNVRSVSSALKGHRAIHEGHTLASVKATTAQATVEEKNDRYITTVRSAAEAVTIGLVTPVTFPWSAVEAKWTYVDRQTPQTLDLKLDFDGYQVHGQKPVRVKIPSISRGLTFETLAKQIDDGSLRALRWSPYQQDRPADELAVSLASTYHIHLPTLGHVYFAELVMTRYLAMFSMVRLELGSPFSGGGAIAYALPNGGRYP